MLNDADGQGGGNASDYEARETVAYAEALFSKLKKWIVDHDASAWWPTTPRSLGSDMGVFLQVGWHQFWHLGRYGAQWP